MASDSDSVLPANMRGVARHLANHEECEPTGSAHRLLVRGADEIDRLRARVAELEGERQRGRTYAVSLLGSACEAARSRLKALLGDPKQDHYTRATMSQIDRALEVAAGLDTPATKGGADGE